MTDLGLLIDFFLKLKKRTLQKNRLLRLSPDARMKLMNHTWPGNVRELENVIERLYVFCDGEVTENDLPGSVREPASRHSLLMEDVEKQHIARGIDLKEGNLTRTALALGIALNTLKSKMHKYALDLNRDAG